MQTCEDRTFEIKIENVNCRAIWYRGEIWIFKNDILDLREVSDVFIESEKIIHSYSKRKSMVEQSVAMDWLNKMEKSTTIENVEDFRRKFRFGKYVSEQKKEYRNKRFGREMHDLPFKKRSFGN